MIPIKSQISNILQQTYPLNSSVHNSFSPACTADAQQKRQALLQAPSLLPNSQASGNSAGAIGEIRPDPAPKDVEKPRFPEEFPRIRMMVKWVNTTSMWLYEFTGG